MIFASLKNFIKNQLLIVFFLLIRVTGLIIGILPRPKSFICFIGHSGHFNGNAKFLFEEYVRNIDSQPFYPVNLRPVFIIKKSSSRNTIVNGKYEFLPLDSMFCRLRLWYVLWRTNILVITTPGFEWRARHLFAWRAKTVLLSNGIPLKSPGVISKHFSKQKALKYECLWRDIDRVWVSSQLERYIASSSLRFPIERVEVRGAARQEVFSQKKFSAQRDKARKKIESLIGPNVANKHLVLLALTHRDYMRGATFSAIESIENLRGVKIEDMKNFLKTENIQIVIRDHFLAFQSTGEKWGEHLVKMNAEILPELNDVIAGFDAVLTDYSGLYLDLLSTSMPIGLLRFPKDDFVKERGLILPDNFLTAGMEIATSDQLKKFLRNRYVSEINMLRRNILNDLFFEVSPDKCLESNIEGLAEVYMRKS